MVVEVAWESVLGDGPTRSCFTNVGKATTLSRAFRHFFKELALRARYRHLPKQGGDNDLKQALTGYYFNKEYLFQTFPRSDFYVVNSFISCFYLLSVYSPVSASDGS